MSEDDSGWLWFDLTLSDRQYYESNNTTTIIIIYRRGVIMFLMQPSQNIFCKCSIICLIGIKNAVGPSTNKSVD